MIVQAWPAAPKVHAVCRTEADCRVWLQENAYEGSLPMRIEEMEVYVAPPLKGA